MTSPIIEAIHDASQRTEPSDLNFNQISRLSDIEADSRRLGVPRAETLEHLQVAVGFCEAVGFSSKYRSLREVSGNEPSRSKVAREYNEQFAKAFCDSPGLNSDAINAEILSLDPTDDMLQAQFLEALSEEEAKAVGVPSAARLMLEAESVSTAKRAAQFLLGQDLDLPQTKRLPMPVGADRGSMQVLALEMLACDIRGGCGRNGFYTVAGCGSSCRPGITLPDVWREQYPPQAIRYARALAAAIHSDRVASRAPR